MKYFLFFAAGSCNDGSCTYCLQEFDSLAEAENALEEQRWRSGEIDPSYTIVHGRTVRDSLTDQAT